MEHATRGGGQRPSALVAVTLVLLGVFKAGPAQALPADGDAAAGHSRVIAAVSRGHELPLHAAPAGRVVGVLHDRTPFGSPTRLAVLGRRGGWLAVSSAALGDARPAWIKPSEAVRLSRTRYRVVVSLHARR